MQRDSEYLLAGMLRLPSGKTMIGERLGKYTILKSLGTGSMGTVYKAEDNDTGSHVAIKLIRAQVLYDSEKRERFLQGMLAVSEIRHPGICPILDVGDDEDDFFVVMPFLDGRTLEQHLERKPIPWPEAVVIALAVGSALEAVHLAGAVHRGLKSSNVWLLEGGTLLVSDCSMARFTEIDKKSHALRQCGGLSQFAETLVPMAALAYMSPEQVRGEPVDARTDIFSFGALIYEMLTGRHPFDARNSLSRMSAILEADPPAFSAKAGPVPARLEAMVRKALAKDPAERPQTIGSMLEELRPLQDGVNFLSLPAARKLLSPWATFLTILSIALAALIYWLLNR
jgi:serine/threonine protein kinase